MQKDYARRLQRKQKTAWKRSFTKYPHKRNKKPVWTVALVICILFFGLVSALFYIKQHIQSTPSFSTSHPLFAFFKKRAKIASPHQAQSTNNLTAASYEQPTQFDFYNMLPKIKVETGNTSETKPQEKYQDKQQAESMYVLQIASVRSASEAHKIQNLLTEKGFTSHVVPITRGDQIWYRIQLGPFKNETEAESTKTLLQKQKIHSILISNDAPN